MFQAFKEEKESTTSQTAAKDTDFMMNLVLKLYSSDLGICILHFITTKICGNMHKIAYFKLTFQRVSLLYCVCNHNTIPSNYVNIVI